MTPPSARPPRTFLADKAPGALGADIGAGINLGLTDAMPEISGKLADLHDFDALTGAKRESAVKDYLGSHFDPFSQIVLHSTDARGVGFRPAAEQSQINTMRGALIDKMTRGGLAEMDLRKSKKILPPPPPDPNATGQGDSGLINWVGGDGDGGDSD